MKLLCPIYPKYASSTKNNTYVTMIELSCLSFCDVISVIREFRVYPILFVFVYVFLFTVLVALTTIVTRTRNF